MTPARLSGLPLGSVAPTAQSSGRRTSLATVEAEDQPDLHSFAAGLMRDYDAVHKGLTMSYSSGAVEGPDRQDHNVLKRQMFGHAKLDPLPQASPPRHLSQRPASATRWPRP